MERASVPKTYPSNTHELTLANYFRSGIPRDQFYFDVNRRKKIKLIEKENSYLLSATPIKFERECAVGGIQRQIAMQIK